MTKTMLTVIVGVFITAFAVEMVTRRKHPPHGKLSKAAKDFGQAFLDGYHGDPAAKVEAKAEAS